MGAGATVYQVSVRRGVLRAMHHRQKPDLSCTGTKTYENCQEAKTTPPWSRVASFPAPNFSLLRADCPFLPVSIHTSRRISSINSLFLRFPNRVGVKKQTIRMCQGYQTRSDNYIPPLLYLPIIFKVKDIHPGLLKTSLAKRK